jgi:hypothetical protein
MQAWTLFLVSMERGTSRRVYHRRPWLSDTSQLGGAPCWLLARPGCGTRRCRRTEARNKFAGRPDPPRLDGPLSAAKGKQIRSILRSRCERRHVDDEAIANILAHEPFDRSVDVLDTNELDVGLDVPGRAEGLHRVPFQRAIFLTHGRSFLHGGDARSLIGISSCSRQAARTPAPNRREPPITVSDPNINTRRKR